FDFLVFGRPTSQVVIILHYLIQIVLTLLDSSVKGRLGLANDSVFRRYDSNQIRSDSAVLGNLIRRRGFESAAKGIIASGPICLGTVAPSKNVTKANEGGYRVVVRVDGLIDAAYTDYTCHRRPVESP